MGPLRVVLLALTLAAGAGASAAAAELVMFEKKGCPWCAAWMRDVGQHYADSDHAKLLPLRQVDVDEPQPPELAKFGQIRFTPTFVAIACGEEVDRIIGYPGPDNFWERLDQAVAKLRSQREASKTTC